MRYKYSKYNGEDLDGVDLDDLLSKLSDLLLSSGFSGKPVSAWSDADNTMQALHDAIMDALMNGELLPQEMIDQLLNDTQNKNRLEQLIKELIDRLEQEGYITSSPDLEADKAQRQARGTGNGQGQQSPPVTFEVTDKGLDFLGFRALRDLLGSLGKSSFGRHDTRDLSTGVETTGAPKPYAFGDTLNLDPSSTILNAVRRMGLDAHARAAADGDAPVIDVQYRGSDGGPGRVPEFLRDRADARLQPQHDPLR